MAKTDWEMNDTVMPADMNQIGEEINDAAATAAAAETPAGAQEKADAAAATAEQNANDYTDQQIAKIPPSVGQRTATLVVAASNSSPKSKDGADYVCTGTDDQTTINAAIGALPPGSGKLLLLEGLYTVSGSINLVSNMILEGMGAATIIKLRNNHNASVDVVAGSSITNTTIQDLKIDGNKSNQTSGIMRGVWLFTGSANCTISGLKVSNLRGDGIYINNSSGNTITENTCNGNSGNGIYISGISNYNTILGNTCSGNSNIGINVNSIGNYNTIIGNTCSGNSAGISTSSSDSTITGNTCSGNSGDGIYINGSGNTITGNTLNGNSGTGIYIDSSGNYNNVQSNTVRRGSATPTYGIRVKNNTGNLITNNDLYDSGTTAFSNGGTDTITTAGNRT